jgi:hypothetical protein
MKRFYLLIICLFICYPAWSYASNDIDGAKKFINEFLKEEFIGNNTVRISDAIYSPRKKLLLDVDNKEGLRGDLFQWESEKLCVVDGYEVTNIKIINSKAIINVTFQEYACTGSTGYADIPLIKTNRKSQERYSLEYKKNRWWIKDPPIPRISRKALIEYNDGNIREMSDWILKKGVEKQKEYYQNIVNTNNILKGN